MAQYRALVYVRKSQVRRRRDEISPERQLENCLTASEAHGWTVDEGDIYRDAEGHRSGRTEDHRPAWRALKARLSSDDTVAAVVVNSLDRSSRSPKDFFNFLDMIQQHKIEIVSVTEQFDTSTAIGRAFLAMLMVVASLESDLASERTAATVEYLRKQGVHWGRTPYGYTRDENAIPQPDADAPSAIAALEAYAQGVLSYKGVANLLNLAGHRWRLGPGRRVPFMESSVRSLVNSVLIYAGWVPKTSGTAMRIAHKAESIEELALLTDAVPGRHPGLIDEELANRVLAAQNNRKGKSPRAGAHQFLLTSLLKCADCGGKMFGKRDRRWAGVPRYYHKHGTCSHGQGSADADTLEAEVLSLLDIPLDAEMVADIKEGVTERSVGRPENEALKRQLAARKAELDRIRELYVLGDFTQVEYITRRSQTVTDIRELEDQIGESDYPVEKSVKRIEELGTILRGGNRHLQKRALPTIFKSVSVGLGGEIASVELQDWAKPFLLDLVRVAQKGYHDQVRAERAYCAQKVVALTGLDKDLSTGGIPLPPLTQAPDRTYPARPG